MRNLQITKPCNPIISVLVGMQKNYGRYGAISAFLSPQNSELRNDLDPRLDCNKNRYQQDGSGNPKVMYNYDPMFELGGGNTEMTCKTGEKIPDPLSGEYVMNLKREMKSYITSQEWIQFCCGADDYFKAKHPNVSFDSKVNVMLANLDIAGVVKRSVGNRIDADFLRYIEVDGVKYLNSSVGVNPVTGSTSAQQVKLINVDGQVTTELNIIVQQIQAKMNWCVGKWILLTGTGSKVLEYMNRCNISCCNSAQGLDPKSILNQTSSYFDWYRSTEIDNILGQDAAFLIAPNTIAAHFMGNFDFMNGTKWDNIQYGKFQIEGSYCDSDVCIGQNSFTPMSFGLRATEVNCREGNVYPALDIAIDTMYGFFAKPQGFYYSYGPYVGVNGIISLTFI